MKKNCTISLQNRLTLTNALFISAALGILTIIINSATGLIFTALVKENIAGKSGEIVRVMEEQYDPLNRVFDTATVEAMGMYFVHEGYIISVEDEQKNTVWDARACDMRECMDVVTAIAGRMEERFHINGAMQTQEFSLSYAGRAIGKVIIETYGPFFFSETETRFLTSINRILLTAAAVLVLLSVIISAVLARAIARPVLTAEKAARRIAQVHGALTTQSGSITAREVIRINDQYKTAELAALSRAINDLAAELEEGERRQKQLTADIAHELGTPLTCLQGTIEAMIDGVFKPDREHLESCHEEILRLAGLVSDLRTLTSLEWENITLAKTEFDLLNLLRITAEQFRPEAHEKGITIDLEEPAGSVPALVTADYARLKQVFINILSNAVKYTVRGGITVSIKATEPGEDRNPPGAFTASPRWETSVADTGAGIPTEDLPRVFERFYRSDKSRSRNTGGSGIGLAIAAAIVAAHGGTISAESGPAGTVFRVRV
ncbi:MAG: HAMP domain-containing protein [Treponema sp.]|jgi:signal transduction histidine kinase|nr:HAMP domain-containing protein [Treponema sp.]